MKKAIACLLALPLALAACGAQGADSAQSQPATETEQTTETAQKTTAPAVSSLSRFTSFSAPGTTGPGYAGWSWAASCWRNAKQPGWKSAFPTLFTASFPEGDWVLPMPGTAVSSGRKRF